MKLRPWATALVAALLVLSFTSSCVRVKKEYPEKRYYVLDVSRSGCAATHTSGTILTIHRLRVSPQFEGKGFIYRRKRLSYESDFYSEFLIPPGSLITELVRRWMTGFGLFEHVVDSSSRVAPTHTLEGSVTALYGDYSKLSAPRAVLEIQFFLSNEVLGRSRVVFAKSYRREMPIDKTSPESLANGWNEALRQILAEYEGDLCAKGSMWAKE